MEKKFVKVDIVKTDEIGYDSDRIIDTFILVNPDCNKLGTIQDMLDHRFEKEKPFEYHDFLEYLEENFEILKPSKYFTFEW